MPTTGRYPLVQLESIYLTKTGASNGTPCKIKVSGLEALAVTNDFQVVKALNGLPYVQVSDAQLGKPISLAFEQMEESVYDSIVTEIQAVLSGSKSELDLEITNTPYGSFSIDVVPDVNPVRHDHEFSNTSLKNGSFHFLTTTN